MTFDVYEVTNLINGKKYIGRTKLGVADRWKDHVRVATSKNCPYALHRAIRKYGVESFLVVTVATMNSEREMLDKEIELIASIVTIAPSGYNMTKGGDGVVSPCAEVIEKLRSKQLGKRYFLGRKHSEETLRKMSASAIRSPEHRAAISRAHKGKTVSAETRAKMSASKKGQGAGISRAKHSDETKMKMRLAWKTKRRPISPEWRAKMVVTQIANNAARRAAAQGILRAP